MSEHTPFGPHSESAARRRLREAEERRHPLPDLPEPDAWSARWILAASIVLLVGALVPQPDVAALAMGGGDWDRPPFVWPWEVADRLPKPFYELWAPVAWASLGLVSLRLRGGWRGASLLVGALGLGLLDAFVPGGPEWPNATGIRFGETVAGAFVPSLGFAAVVAGNHLRKRSPMSRVPAGFSGFGGIVCVLSALLPCESFVPVYTHRGFDGPREDLLGGLLLRAAEWRQGWPMLVVGILGMGLALLGVRSFSMRNVPRRCARVSVFARVLLCAHALASFGLVAAIARLSWLPLRAQAVLAFRRASFSDGALILTATGLAACFEGFPVGRGAPSSVPLDPPKPGALAR